MSGTAAYVGDTQYNVRGQMIQRLLGTTPAVKLVYNYTAAENFRLVSLQAGVSPTYTNLQNISYGYDDVGNVLTISDAAAYDGDATPATQTQSFTYDALHRLKTAQTSGAETAPAVPSHAPRALSPAVFRVCTTASRI